MWAHDFRHRRGKGDDVVPHFSLDLVNAFDPEIRALANGSGGLLRNHSFFGEGLRGSNLDRQPGPKTVFVTPDAAHLGACVTRDQRGTLPSSAGSFWTKDSNRSR